MRTHASLFNRTDAAARRDHPAMQQLLRTAHELLPVPQGTCKAEMAKVKGHTSTCTPSGGGALVVTGSRGTVSCRRRAARLDTRPPPAAYCCVKPLLLGQADRVNPGEQRLVMSRSDIQSWQLDVWKLYLAASHQAHALQRVLVAPRAVPSDLPQRRLLLLRHSLHLRPASYIADNGHACDRSMYCLLCNIPPRSAHLLSASRSHCGLPAIRNAPAAAFCKCGTWQPSHSHDAHVTVAFIEILFEPAGQWCWRIESMRG